MYTRLVLVVLALLLFIGAQFLPAPEPGREPLVSLSHATTTPPTATVTSSTPLGPEGPLKRAITTVFWVGEGASASNDYIANDESAWDGAWQKHYGGVDNPEKRCDFAPCAFAPKENPFYIALPYNDFTEGSVRKASAIGIPWYGFVAEGQSLLKNRWVEVSYRGTTCYGQWEDVGPSGEDDFGYVFGTSTTPVNVFGEKAGLDISPALRDCLHAPDVSITYWRFVERTEVPAGPWLSTVTESGTSW